MQRRWRVAEEVTGEVTVGKGVVVQFDRGKFEMEGGKFTSPGSTARGRKGILLQEVDKETGADIEDSRVSVGEVALQQARRLGAIL